MLFRRALWTAPFLLLAGCQNAPRTAAPPVSSFSSPKDDLGREIPLKVTAKRVIVIGPGAIETVFALGAAKQLVGRDDYADFPVEAKKVAIAGNYQGPNVEKSVALRPDLVIVQGETWDKARVEGWEQQIGVPVAALVATDLAGVRRDFVKMGAWLGRDKAAQQLARSLKKIGPSALPTPRAFFEVGRSPLYSAGRGTLIADVMRAGGFGNIADDIKGYQPFGLENLISRAPDVYIATSKRPREAAVRELRANAALSKLKCVQKGAVIVVDGDWLLRPGPRLRLGIQALIRARNERIN